VSRLRGAILGFGNIAEFGHWPSYAASPDVEIVAILEPSALRQKAAQARKAGLRAYDSLEALLAAEKPDFVDICTPPASHAPLALQALEAGAHVLCEKPLSLKSTEYAALAEAQARSGKIVFTVHNWKYAPIYQKAFEWLQAGRIGRVWHADLFVLRNSHCKGAATSAKRVSQDWRTDRGVAGGGILVDHGWHAFYLLLNLIGQEPQKLLAKTLLPTGDPRALEEAAQALISFPEADAYLHLTWRAPFRRNTALVQGMNGTLWIDDDRLRVTTRDGRQDEARFDAALSAGSHHADWFQRLLPAFLEELRDPAQRGRNFREAGWCLAMTSAAYESSAHNATEAAVRFPSTEIPAAPLRR
jgi:predicted dehydrogenase